MTRVRVVLEYMDAAGSPAMRWERMAVAEQAFELLGRAFEVAQREDGMAFAEAVAGFLRGAVLRKQDVTEALAALDEDASRA